MFLSNPATFFVITVVLSPLLWSCGADRAATNKDLNELSAQHSGFPFSVKEPEVFRGYFVVTVDGNEKKWFLARSGSRRRLDIFSSGEPLLTELVNDKTYLIDHRRKAYAEQPMGTGLISSSDPLLSGFFRSREFHKFEDAGIENGLRKYKLVLSDELKDDIFLFFDESTGLIVRQEFRDGTGPAAEVAVVYELRELSLEVDDSTFDLPAGYMQVSFSEAQHTKGKTPPAK